jgi:hypothetical protein
MLASLVTLSTGKRLHNVHGCHYVSQLHFQACHTCRDNEIRQRWVCEEVWRLSATFVVDADVLMEAQVSTI